jgi:hypothetical protein
MNSRCLLIALLTFLGFQTSYAAPVALTEFLEGKKSKFSTKNHAKALGLTITLEYPNSWSAKEAVLAHITQKFTGPSGTALLTIVDPQDGGDLSRLFPQILESERNDALKAFTPPDGTFEGGKVTKIDGLPAVMIEYTKVDELAGKPYESTNLGFLFMCEGKMVGLEFLVIGGTNSESERKARLKESLPLFTLMAESIVIEDRRK